MKLQDNPTKEEVLTKLFQAWTPARETEKVGIEEAYGRILAEDVTALYNLPVVRSSSFDGIAVDSTRFRDGMPDTSAWRQGTDFVRADTGDDFDDAFDAVIMIERVTIHPGGGLEISLPAGTSVTAGMNVRPAGSMYRRGELLAPAGRRLSAPLLASIVSGGHSEVSVVRRPRVAYIPTGSELVPPGSIPARGQNINSNSTLIRHMLLEMGAEPDCRPIVRDDMDSIEKALTDALATSDIVLLSGGSSKGEEDYTFRVMEKLGTLLNHGVRAVPGRPMSVGIVRGKPVINISGPALAALNCTQWCVRPAVARCLGTRPHRYPTVAAVLDGEIGCPGFMTMLKTINISRNEDGSFTATPLKAEAPDAGHQQHRGPGGPRPRSAASMSANAMFMTPLGVEKLRAGDTITVELLCSPEEV